MKRSLNMIDQKNIPVDEKLPGLAFLFAAEQVEEILKRGMRDCSMSIGNCQISYVRYKPGTNCIVSYSFVRRNRGSADSRKMLAYGKCYTEADYFQATGKAATYQNDSTSCFRPVVSVPEIASIFFMFPNDAELDGLPTVFDSRKLTRYLRELLPGYPKETWRISDKRLRTEVVRYKPEKRAVIRINTRAINRTSRQKDELCLYVRTYGNGRGKEIHDRMNGLRRALSSQMLVKLPEALAYIEDKKLLIVEGMTGDPLLDKLQGPGSEAYITRAAEALAVLHNEGGETSMDRSNADVLADARLTGKTLTGIMPQMADVVREILEALKALESNGNFHTGFVHGDFHYGQILLTDEVTTLLDFDRSYNGETLVDIGNFCAHLRVLELQKRLAGLSNLEKALVTAYAVATGTEPDRERLRLWTAFGLLQLSVFPFRCFDVDWMTKTKAILQDCRGLLC